MQHRTPIILSSLRMHPPREQLWHMSRPVYHRRGLTGIDIFESSLGRCSPDRRKDAASRPAAVRYQVKEVERSVKFYTQHLGFRLEPRHGAHGEGD